ncbi:hypothetical protein pb186bvf_019524 [Paramecium bursaria]
MQSQKFCSCKYKNPLEFICTFKDCVERRIICKSCAWDHKNHDQSVVPIIEWEQMVSNDCTIQRLRSAYGCQSLVQQLENVIEITKNELVQSITKRCNQLIKDVQRHKIAADFSKLIEAVQNVGKKQYTQVTVDTIVKELDVVNLNQQITKIENQQYLTHRTTCRQIVEMTISIEKLMKDFGDKGSGQLEEIRSSIQKRLEQEIEKKPILKFLQEDYEPRMKQSETSRRIPTMPAHMYQSHLQFEQMPINIQQRVNPYADVLNTDKKKSYNPSLAEFSFLGSKYKQQELKNEYRSERNLERQPSQSFHTLPQQKYK